MKKKLFVIAFLLISFLYMCKTAQGKEWFTNGDNNGM